MRLPVPTVPEIRAFVVACVVAVVMISSTLCWAIVHKVNQSDQIVQIAASSADQVERLNRQLDAQQVAAADQRAAARRDSRLTHQQLRAVLRFVKSLGIDIPPALLAQPKPTAGSSSTPKASAHSGAPSSPSPRPTATPGATPRPTTSPSGPDTGGLDPVCALLNLPTCPLLP